MISTVTPALTFEVESPILRPFHPHDLALIVNRDGEQISHEAIIAQAHAGPSFTVTFDGRPIGCAGMVLPWPGVGMVWMVLSEEISEHGLWLFRTVKAFITNMTERHALHRIEAVAIEGYADNQRWITALGFTRERDGFAQKYLADQRSIVRYELVKE